MYRKFLSLFLILSVCFCIYGCKNEKDTETTEEITSEETTEEDTSTADAEETTEEAVNISFSKEKATEIYSFPSEIYGTLKIYLQDGYFIIFDEFDTKRFTIFAENYSPSATDKTPVAMHTDMNSDGYTDFGVCHYRDQLNSYYLCFLWDNDTRTFRYYQPLSKLQNPEFNQLADTVIATNRLTYEKSSVDTYYFLGDDLRLLSSKEVIREPEEETLINGDAFDPDTLIMENGNSALISLNTPSGSDSLWKCRIDNEDIVTLSSENNDKEANKTEFLLTSLSPGETTVIFSYTSPDTNASILDVNINVYVDDNGSVDIVIP